jgi:hypothetical protein
MTGDNITNFFDQDKCGSDEAVKTVYPNGSYACNSISSDQTVENLSETLAAGNVANQTIEFSDGVSIGDDQTSAEFPGDVAVGSAASASKGTSTAVGGGSSASDDYASSFGSGSSADVRSSSFGGDSSASSGSSSAFGYKSSASSGYSSAFGRGSTASGSESTVIGSVAEASGQGALSLGSSSEASQEGSVAVGYQANAPNSYEATFGNLNGQELDVNVTGNLTVHQTIEQPNGIRIGSGSTAIDSTDIAVGQQSQTNNGYKGDTAIGYKAEATGGYSPTAVGRASKATGNYGVALGQFSEAQSSRSTAVGYQAIASNSDAATFGYDSEASGSSSLALGAGAEASGQNSVAIGAFSNAPNQDEATFGSLEDSPVGGTMDVNITGNATIHGQDLDLKNGDIENFFDQDRCGDSEAIKTIYPNGSYECNTISSDQTTENLTETLNAGNEASRDIDLKGNNLTSSDGEVCAGDLC